MRPDFAALFEQIDFVRRELLALPLSGINLRVVPLDEFRQMEGGGKPGRAGADDQHIRF